MSGAAPAVLELPSVAPAAPKRQLFVGTAVACLGGSALVGGMLAIWALLRERAVSGGARFPLDYIIHEVATNVMLMTIWSICLFAQWAVYAGTRGDRSHTALALGVGGVLAVAFLNAQAFTWSQMGVVLADDGYGALFYAMTGTIFVIGAIGLLYSVVAAFRALSGRLTDTDVLTAHALYWYWAAAAYTAIWFLVYVTK
ncbi:MAG TPA: cytochrome c oxidase subunit 3 [Ilumatobacter sp.]|nr:cytochrome c oxidase subunit 3 [Ilumatobacter sp.]